MDLCYKLFKSDLLTIRTTYSNLSNKFQILFGAHRVESFNNEIAFIKSVKKLIKEFNLIEFEEEFIF